jgi:hypothetical protein
MHEQGKSAPTSAEKDAWAERAVLVEIIEAQPGTMRLSDLIRENGGQDDFSRRDEIERAVRELISFGLLFRCETALLPTRSALHAYELLVETD